MDKQSQAAGQRTRRISEVNNPTERAERQSAEALRSVVAPDVELDDFLPWYRVFNAQAKMNLDIHHTEAAARWWKLSNFSDQ